MEENRWRTMLRSGEIALGIYNFIPSETIVDVVGYAGLDFIIFDAEHTSYDVSFIERGVRAAEAVGLVSVARLPGTSPDPRLITRVLDTGVDGLLFARIASRQTAEEIVRLCRIPPLGDRGTCPGSRAGRHRLMPLDEYNRLANDVAIAVMIETKAAFEEAEEIVRLPGIDGVAVGKSDLATSMGLPGGRYDPKVYENEQHILKLAKSAGIGVKAGVRTVAEFDAYLQLEDGPRVFSYGTDGIQLGSRLHDLVQGSRELIAQTRA